MTRPARTRRVSLLAALVSTLLTGGCTLAADQQLHDRVLDIAWATQPPSLDPLAVTSASTRDVARNVFESLVVATPDGGVVPQMAESYRVSPDRRRMTLKLRTGLVFHDGSPVTVEDVKASVERWMDKSVAGKSFFEGARVVRIDDRTVEVVTPKPLYTAPNLLANTTQMLAIMPKRVIDRAGPSGVTEIVGTGPFRLVHWKADSQLKLAKFDRYQSVATPAAGLSGAKNPAVDAMVFHFVADPSTRLSGLQTGEYDAADSVPPDSAPFVRSNGELTMRANINGFNAVVFNKKSGVMRDVRMRRAVRAALDTRDIQTASLAKADYYTLDQALMPAADAAWHTGVGLSPDGRPSPAGDARSLAAQAGYRGQPLRILATREYDDSYRASVVVQQQLRKAGFDAVLEVYDWPTLLNRRSEPANFEMFVTGLAPVTVPVLYPFLGPNWPGWTDDERIRQSLDDINSSAGAAQAGAALDRLQRAYLDAVPIVKFGDKTTITAMRHGWTGYDFQAGDVFWNMRPANR